MSHVRKGGGILETRPFTGHPHSFPSHLIPADCLTLSKTLSVQITIFDHRGCQRKGTEYKGDPSGGQDDEMMVKVSQTQLNIASPAFKELANSVLAVSCFCTPFSNCLSLVWSIASCAGLLGVPCWARGGGRSSALPSPQRTTQIPLRSFWKKRAKICVG